MLENLRSIKIDPDLTNIISSEIGKELYIENEFCRVVDQFLTILIKLSKRAKQDINKEIIQERIDFQKNYCVQQMKNEKTSMVLLKYFDEKWVNNYIKTVLFDF